MINAYFWASAPISRCTRFSCGNGSRHLCLLVCPQSDPRPGLHRTVKYAQSQLRSEASASSSILVTIVTHPSAQALAAGNHADFQFYIVINAAGEENFTTIAGVDRTKPRDTTTPQTEVLSSPPTHTQLPLLFVLKWFPQSLPEDGCCKGCSVSPRLHQMRKHAPFYMPGALVKTIKPRTAKQRI